MPTLSQIKQYLSLTVIPVLAGALANWLVVHLHFLASFHITASGAAGVISQLGVFAVSAGLAFLASHHILKGTYAPKPAPVATYIQSSGGFSSGGIIPPPTEAPKA